MSSALLSRLSEFLPTDSLLRDPTSLASYGRDWTRLHEPRPCAVALPRSTEEVARILALCHELGAPVVPSGGRTGLSGGAVASRGELVLSLERMRRMDPVDPASRTLRVQAGAVTEAVHEYCRPHGLTWPVDFASKGSSQVGGNIATNAGGVRVIRYGLTRAWVLALQVVTPQGEILELNGDLEKNNTGPDLRQLIIGSEGTLAIVTEATLKLAPLPGESEVTLFALRDLASVLRLYRSARESDLTINAFEMMSRPCLERVIEHRGLRDPFAGATVATLGYSALLEIEGESASWLEQALALDGVLDATLAQSPEQARELWTLREGISESLAARSIPHKNDLSLPHRGLEPFCSEIEAMVAQDYPGWEIYLFGHIGDGNLHLNILKPRDLPVAEFVARTSDVDRRIFELIQKHRGSVSAEHGIGLLKKAALPYSRTPTEIALMRAIKKAWDPRGILNPGKVFD